MKYVKPQSLDGGRWGVNGTPASEAGWGGLHRYPSPAEVERSAEDRARALAAEGNARKAARKREHKAQRAARRASR